MMAQLVMAVERLHLNNICHNCIFVHGVVVTENHQNNNSRDDQYHYQLKAAQFEFTKSCDAEGKYKKGDWHDISSIFLSNISNFQEIEQSPECMDLLRKLEDYDSNQNEYGEEDIKKDDCFEDIIGKISICASRTQEK
uniref:Protein kinase domain-containing protein n=1 Tax=Ditylenchus dipsaci TaxID=166011 RepID=A0A915CWY9_9BILA